jgi:Tfp pilus assembly protein PilF
MTLFWFNKKENDKFLITEPDKIWVEESFKWLIKAYGYPYRGCEQILLTNIYFQKTFKEKIILIENIIADLCSLLQIKEDKISFKILSDIRDTNEIPFEIEGTPFETELELEGGKFKIFIANSIQNHPKRIIYNLVYEFIKIKLIDNKIQYDSSDDKDLFIFIAGIYFGFGVLLSQNLRDIGRFDDGIWETKWYYISEMPNEVMAYGLATYAKLIEQNKPKWKEYLPSDLKRQFIKAMKYLDKNPNNLYNKYELEANELFDSAYKQYLKNEFKDAIVTLKKILTLTTNEIMKADVYNNLGYYNLRLKNYEQSIKYFKNSIQVLPNYGYANDNLGYALIQLGKLEEGKKWLDKAILIDSNDIAYTYRNLALYHLAKGDLNSADKFFKKSFATVSDSVDLLEYHYADFLFQKGKTKEGIEYLNKAVKKGEPEAIEKMNEFKCK